MPSNNRVFSRDVSHLRDDLRVSLTFALGPEPTSDSELVASSILDEMTGFDSSQQCLDSIRTRLGPRVFGHVTMFHMYAGTSLSGVSSQATSVRTLRQNGLTLRDLAWPPSQLKEQFQEHAIADTAVEQRLEEAVATWKAESAL